MAKAERREQILREAWVGDAVLGLYVREKILREDGRVDGEKFGKMTSNQFLLAFGEPSEVEAQIGRVYATEGLAGAFSWIEAKLLPLWTRQEEKRLRRLQ